MSELLGTTNGSGFADDNGPIVGKSAVHNGSFGEALGGEGPGGEGAGVKGWDSLYQELEALGAEIARLSVDSLAAGQERLAADIEMVKQNVAAMLRQAKERGSSLNQTALAFTRSYPLTASLIAFGAGAVVTRLLSRRR